MSGLSARLGAQHAVLGGILLGAADVGTLPSIELPTTIAVAPYSTTMTVGDYASSVAVGPYAAVVAAKLYEGKITVN